MRVWIKIQFSIRYFGSQELMLLQLGSVLQYAVLFMSLLSSELSFRGQTKQQCVLNFELAFSLLHLQLRFTFGPSFCQAYPLRELT